jgi:rSAM/selenodomain-associated transferase 1
MAKWPAPGAVKTRLQPPLDPEGAARLYAAFVADLMAELGGVAEASLLILAGGSPVTGRRDQSGGGGPEWPLSSPPANWPDWPVVPQRGRDLGERLAAAFADLAADSRPVVLVGADHPDLPRAEVEAAFDALSSHELVLGPAVDGGYYLIGLQRAVPRLFVDMPWSTSELLRATLDRAHQLGLRTAATRPWYDVDRPRDLAFLRQHLRLVRAARPDRLRATAAVLSELDRIANR